MKPSCDTCEWAWWRPGGGDGDKYADTGICLASSHPVKHITRNSKGIPRWCPKRKQLKQ